MVWDIPGIGISLGDSSEISLGLGAHWDIPREHPRNIPYAETSQGGLKIFAVQASPTICSCLLNLLRNVPLKARTRCFLTAIKVPKLISFGGTCSPS